MKKLWRFLLISVIISIAFTFLIIKVQNFLKKDWIVYVIVLLLFFLGLSILYLITKFFEYGHHTDKTKSIELIVAIVVLTFIIFQTFIMNKQSEILDKQTEILNKTALSVEPNLNVWYEGINDPIPINVDVLTHPEIWDEILGGYGLDLCMKNLAQTKLSSIHFELRENEKFDSSIEVIENLWLDRQCKNIKIRQKNCYINPKDDCNPKLFNNGEKNNL